MSEAELLTNWIKQKHAGQMKKYAGEPYFYHLSRVADMAKDATPLGYEIGLCHDLLEDTGTSQQELITALRSFDYDQPAADHITNATVALTDVFTATAYPGLSREVLKEKEALRIRTISASAQTVKYADLIDNMQIIIQYAPQHANLYLRKKQLLLTQMTAGNKTLRQKALMIVREYFM